MLLLSIWHKITPPYCANLVLRIFADDHLDLYQPDMMEANHKDFFVDDFLSSVVNMGGARVLARGTPQILSNVGFELAKWATNYLELRESIPVDHSAELSCLRTIMRIALRPPFVINLPP